MDLAKPELSESEQLMMAAGVAIDEPAFEDYFDFGDTRQWFFPDGKQYIEYTLMNEGGRSLYQSSTTSDVRLFKTSGDASIKMNPADERWILFQESITGWMLMHKNKNTGAWSEVEFDKGGKPKKGGAFYQWYDKANPKLISALEAQIRKDNPWLRADLSVKDIDEQIEELKNMREEAVKREEGKSGS